MLKYLRFVQDCGVCVNNKESRQHKLVISVPKVLQKRAYYLSLLRVAHCFSMRGEITSGVNIKQIVSDLTF